jgi:16S rRNA (guanine527-N7)-methyltransferase
VQHVGDALTLLAHLPTQPMTLVDVGTGGGVPGIPLAIAVPSAKVTLVEATQKKCAFLQKTVDALELSNVRVVAQRAEDVGLSNLRETFDFAVARAVATVPWLCEWCLPLVKVGGTLMLMKGPKVHEELLQSGRALKLMGGGKPVLHSVDLPGAQGLVIAEIAKVAPTDRRYPRKASVAKGTPVL